MEQANLHSISSFVLLQNKSEIQVIFRGNFIDSNWKPAVLTPAFHRLPHMWQTLVLRSEMLYKVKGTDEITRSGLVVILVWKSQLETAGSVYSPSEIKGTIGI